VREFTVEQTKMMERRNPRRGASGPGGGYEQLSREELTARLIAEQELRRALEAQREGTEEYDRLLGEVRAQQLELEVQNRALRETQ